MSRKQPKYRRIYKVLKDRTLNGTNQEMVLSESKLIQEFKVSATTAKKVLNDLQTDGLLERKVGKGSILVPQSQRKNKELGVIFFDIFSADDPHIASFVSEIEGNARQKDYHLHLFTTRNKPFSQDPQSTLYDLVVRRKLGGLFIISPIPSSDLKFLQREKIPFVVVGNDYPAIDVPSVTFDFKRIFREFAEKLFHHKYCRIAVSITGIHLPEKILRNRDFLYEGYQNFLKENNLLYDEKFFVVSEQPGDNGLGAMERWYKLPVKQRPQVIITGCYDADQGTRSFLQKHPDWRPLVISLTNESGNSNYGIICSETKIGQTAFQLMEDLLNENKVESIKRKVSLDCILPEEIYQMEVQNG